MNYYPLLIALGLLFLAASFLVTHSTGRIALGCAVLCGVPRGRDHDRRRDRRGARRLSDHHPCFAALGRPV